MSQQITKAFVTQFKDNVQFLVQQKGSRLMGTTMEEPITGEKAFFEQIGPSEMQEMTTRHGDTQYTDTDHDRRMCVFKDYSWADLVDRKDRLRMLIEPTNAYAINAARAAGRQRDRVIIDAATGTAQAGKDGTTPVTLPASQQVAVNFVDSGSASNTNLTVAKVVKAAEILNANEAEDEERFAAISASQLRALLRDEEMTSNDFNTMRPLTTGRMPVDWMGFRWIRTELLKKAGDVRSCLFWQREGIKLGIGEEMLVRIDELPSKNYSTQVWVSGSWGATRLQEELVVEVKCDETAAV